MEFVKLKTRYYLDGALLRAGEAAEVLWCRGKAYAGDQESDGFIPTEMLPLLTPTRGKARAAALVREGLWQVVPGGWLDISWEADQVSKADLEQKREAGRQRVAAHRKRTRNSGSNGVTNSELRSTEVREKREEDAAAAASSAAAADDVADQPDERRTVKLEILRSRLQRHTPLAGLRFDTITAAQAVELEQLIDLHGDERLVEFAVKTCRNPPPVSVTAFLGTWSSLPAPGQVLAVVKPLRCTTHDIQLSAAGVCRGCASDEKAAK